MLRVLFKACIKQQKICHLPAISRQFVKPLITYPKRFMFKSSAGMSEHKIGNYDIKQKIFHKSNIQITDPYVKELIKKSDVRKSKAVALYDKLNQLAEIDTTDKFLKPLITDIGLYISNHSYIDKDHVWDLSCNMPRDTTMCQIEKWGYTICYKPGGPNETDCFIYFS
jgi:hypothetical protein